MGSSILMKTDRNGKISLSTNKSKKTNSPANMNAAIKKELGLLEGGNLRKRPLPSKNQMIMQLQRANNLSGFRSASRQVNNERFTRNINQTGGKLCNLLTRLCYELLFFFFCSFYSAFCN